MYIEKPWGAEFIICENYGWRIKLLMVKEGHRTSKQFHLKKDEYWFYPDGTVKHVAPKCIHRLEGPITVIELAWGSDDDIVRLEDDYDRIK